MSDIFLSETIFRELKEFGRKQILVRNLHGTRKFINVLSTVLDDMRILTLDCTDRDSLRESLLTYFVGDGLPEMDTAFEAGWRSHLTEMSLYSRGDGLEIAAGLQSIKEDIRQFLLHREGDERVIGQGLALLLSSFAWSLPTLICFIEYSGGKESMAEALHSGNFPKVPPVLVCRKDSGDYPWADVVLESGMMSPECLSLYLQEAASSATVAEVLAATGGEEGLVALYVGLLGGSTPGDVYDMLESFLQSNQELALFARTAAVFGIEFLPDEISILSGIKLKPESVHKAGVSINIWTGHKVGRFSSAGVRSHLLRSVSSEEKDELLRKAADVVIQFRGNNSRSCQAAGDLLARAGMNQRASDFYFRSAEHAAGDLRKGEMYRRAALLSENNKDHLLYLSALNLYKGEFFDEALAVIEPLVDSSVSTITMLQGLCITSASNSFSQAIEVPEETGVPELVPGVLESRILHRDGCYWKAERILLNCAAGGDSISSVVCLVELGEQLFKRGLVENSLNTSVVAMREAVLLGADWLERKALVTCLRVYNRLGNHKKVDSQLGRLIELTLLCGNRRRLISVYNIYANSQLLRHRYLKALSIYSTALRILTSIQEDHGLRIMILNNMGVAQRRLFRTSESLETMMRQIRISVSSGKLTTACFAYGNMARLFVDMNRVEEASDCLETMVEFAALGKVSEAAEPICYISSQLAFMEGDSENALSLMNESIQFSKESGKKRRLSTGIVKKGSMLLRMNKYREAVAVLGEGLSISRAAGTRLNVYIADMKLTVAKCFLGECDPVKLLSLKYIEDIEDTHKGEQMYHHWCLTGSRQSLVACAQFLSSGLSHGMHFYTYLHMLQDVAGNMPVGLADTIPLLHNYPSCD